MGAHPVCVTVIFHSVKFSSISCLSHWEEADCIYHLLQCHCHISIRYVAPTGLIVRAALHHPQCKPERHRESLSCLLTGLLWQRADL